MSFHLVQETLQRPSEFTGKLVEHHAQSPVHKFKMLAVWPSIAEGFPTARIRVEIYTIKNFSEESLGQDEILRQTSHEHFTSI